MGDLWNRYTDLTVGPVGITSDQLDIEFTVKGSNSSDSNTADIVIYNLSRTTRAKITTDLAVTLKTGYVFDYDTIFSGKVKKVYEERDGGDLKTHITATTLGYATGRTTVKYAKGTALKTIVQKAFEDSGIPVQAINDQGITTDSEYTSEVNASDDLTYCKNLIDGKVEDSSSNLEAAAQAQAKGDLEGAAAAMMAAVHNASGNGIKEAKYYVEANGGYFVSSDFAKSADLVVISKETGLIESVPEDPDDGSYTRSIKCVLNHRITTDSQVSLVSLGAGASGTYKVVEYTHTSSGAESYETEMKVL